MLHAEFGQKTYRCDFAGPSRVHVDGPLYWTDSFVVEIKGLVRFKNQMKRVSVETPPVFVTIEGSIWPKRNGEWTRPLLHCQSTIFQVGLSFKSNGKTCSRRLDSHFFRRRARSQNKTAYSQLDVRTDDVRVWCQPHVSCTQNGVFNCSTFVDLQDSAANVSAVPLFIMIPARRPTEECVGKRGNRATISCQILCNAHLVRTKFASQNFCP